MNNIVHLRYYGEEVAALVTEIPHKQHAMCKVTLESGYSNIFFTDVESGEWVEEDLGFTFLAALVGKEIDSTNRRIVHVPKQLTWHTLFNDGKSLHFGFVSFMNGDHKMFEVYHSNKKYLFTLLQLSHEDWQVLGDDCLEIDLLDTMYIDQLIKVLPFYTCQ